MAASIADFGQLGLHGRVTAAVRALRFRTPLPIQAATIPPALAGRDVIASAETGSGKTLAYLAPLSSLLLSGPRRRGLRVLVIVPTRELAAQVAEVALALSGETRIACSAIYGGVGFGAQTKALDAGVPIVVATPGRLLDHMKRGHAKLHHVGAVVLDEADRLLEMGFIEDVRRILVATPEDRQTMLFSATIDDKVEGLAKEFLRDPVRVRIGEATERHAIPEGIVHEAVVVRQPLKLPLLVHALHDPTWSSVLVFTRTRERCASLAAALVAGGVSASALHSDRSQAERSEALARFRRGELQALVATDVAERGLDIEGITHVVNFDLPGSDDTYLHRVGRTARVFGKGTALSLVTPPEERRFRRMAEALGLALSPREFSGFEFDQKPPAHDPLVDPRPGRGGRRSGPAERAGARGEKRPAPGSGERRGQSDFWARARATREARKKRRRQDG